MTPRILIIAGSDSGGGAGIQADIKTVTMLGGHAMTAITAITAQNTLGVETVMPVPPNIVVQQAACVVEDIGIDAVKIGMLGSVDIARAVASELNSGLYPAAIVFDPVMVATSGAALADRATVETMQTLAQRSQIITPNLPEFATLRGRNAIADDAIESEALDYAMEIGAAVLVKGGHGDGDIIVDRLVELDGTITRWQSPRIDTSSTHGTGCTLSSAIAANLARGLPLKTAVDRARQFVRLALHDAPGLGCGHGPMGHQRVRQDVGFGLASPNHITLPMTDFAATRDFYDLLGLTRIVDAEARYARYESPGGATLSIEAAHELDDKPLLFLECDNLDATVERLRAAGYTVGDPVLEPWEWREARLTDPFGNALCLYQAGENRRYPPWRLPNA